MDSRAPGTTQRSGETARPTAARPPHRACPRCRRLIDAEADACPACGARLTGAGFRLPVVGSVIAVCAVLFLASLLADLRNIGGGGIFGFLSPSGPALWAFGMSGGEPVASGRWWTVLSAGWLHGSLLHIVVNMAAFRHLGPPVLRLYGPSRTLLLWVLTSAFGFVLTAAASTFGFLPEGLQGARFTIGASASLFGLLGVLWGWSRQSGHAELGRQMRSAAGMWLLIGVAAGFSSTGGIRLDNWAHLGGFLAGAALARVLPAGRPEEARDRVLAAVAVGVSLASVGLSLLTALGG